MSITKVQWLGDNHEQWIAQRRETEGIGNIDVTRIGASDVSVITGSNKWKCKKRLFYHLIGIYSLEWRTNKSVAGHLLEPLVALNWESWVQDRDEHLLNLERGITVRKTKKADFFLLNDKYPNLFVSIDRLHDGETFSPFTGQLYDELTPIELKTTEDSYYRLWDSGITKSYTDQVQAQMMVSETKVAVFCVLVNGVYFHVREVEYDSFLADKIDYESRQFATLCKAGKQLVDLIKSAKSESEVNEYTAMLDEISPEPLALEDEQDLAKELFSNSSGSIKGDEKDFQHVVDYTSAMEQIKALEEAKQLAKNNLIVKMKEAEEMVFDGGKVVWRRTPGKREYFSIKLIK